MKFAICQELYEDWSWEQQCAFTAEVGYTGIEVAPFTLAPRITDVSAAKRAELREIATDHGLTILGLHWLLAKTEGFHLTTPDTEVRKATSQYLQELGRAAADLGGNILVLGSPLQRNLDTTTSHEQGMQRAAEVLRNCAPVLGDVGVKLCVEPLTTLETNFLNTCAAGQSLVELVDHPAIVLHQDVKAMLGEETPIPELIQQFAGRVGHFHANDSNKLGPGMGPTDFTEIFAALHAVHYDGWVSVEVFDYSPGAEKISKESLRYMERIWQRVTSRR